MEIRNYTGGFVETNGYLLEEGEVCLLVDAPAGIYNWAVEMGKAPQALLLTHQHFDHTEDVEAIAKAGVPIYAWSAYSEDLVMAEAARRWGYPVDIPPFDVQEILEKRSSVKLGSVNIFLKHVPGHSADSVVFYLPDHGLLFGGDTLFAGSVGRADLPGGNYRLLLESLGEQLLSLPPETKVFPGHGPVTNISNELTGNPYLQSRPQIM